MYRANFYGVSEIKQNDNGDLINIPLPLTSDNGQFELNLEKANRIRGFGYAPSAILRIKNKDNNDIYWNSKDYNTDMFYNPGNFGISPIVNESDVIVLQLQSDGNLVLRSEQNITLSCFASSVNSKYGTHKPLVGGPDRKPYSVKLTNKGKLEIKDKNGDITWSTTYMWESYETPFSVDLISVDEAGTYPFKYPKTTLGMGSVENSIVKEYYKRFYKNMDIPVDFQPFKLVPLLYLLNIGKARFIDNAENGNGILDIDKTGSGNDEALFSFPIQVCPLLTDAYLPIGDLGYVEPFEDKPNINNSIVCLVKNDEKYSKMLYKEDFRIESDSFECDRPTQFRLGIPTSMDKNEYIAVGAVVGVYRLDDDGNPVPILRMAGSNDYFCAAVKNDYLLKYNKTFPGPKLKYNEAKMIEEPDRSNSNQLWVIGGEASGCHSDHEFWMSTPFQTWMVSSNNFNFWSSLNSHNVFYDILPYNVSLAICSGKFSPSIDGEKVSLNNANCNALALTHCSADSGNLPSDRCISYYKYTNTIDNTPSYEDEFNKFCITKEKYKDPAFTKLCSCFLPEKVYKDYFDEIVNGLPEEQREQLRSALTQPSPCVYPACKLLPPEVMPRFKFNTGEKCTDSAIQVCLSKTEIKVEGEGSITGNVSPSTMINCLQQNIKTTPTDTPTTAPPGGNGTTKKSSSNTLWIVLGVVFVVLIILYFTVFKK